MRYLNPDFSSATAAAIVGALGAIGLTAHLQSDTSARALDAIDGSLQSVYEASFDKANPLEGLAVSTMGALRWAVFGQGTQDVVVGRDTWLFTAEEFVADPQFDTRFDAAVAQIADVQSDLSARGIKLLVVALPDKADIYQDKLTVARPERPAMRHAHLVAGLRAHGIPTLDAAHPLRSHRATGDTYLRHDTHWSPLGAQVVAQDAAQIIERWSLDLPAADVTTTPTGTAPHEGDLLAFVDTGALRPWLGPETDSIATYETVITSSGSLFEAAPVEVALVGTSFSAKQDWHFTDFLQQALQAEVINYAEEGQGPFAPMQAMLADPAFTDTPPKLVIWEIPSRYTTSEPRS